MFGGLQRHEWAGVCEMSGIALMFFCIGAGFAAGCCGHEWWAAGLIFASMQLPPLGRVAGRFIWDDGGGR